MTEVYAAYSGSEDSGDFDEITFLNSRGNPVVVSSVMATGFQNMFDELLQAEHAGWETEDGGSGNFTLDVMQRTIVHNHSEYFSRTLRL